MASEENKSTYEEAKRDTQSTKPPIGTPTSGGVLGTGMVLPSGTSGTAKVITGDPSDNVKASTVTVDPNKARVGDYTISSTGNLTVVPGSLADMKQKYQALYGANKRAGWTLSDVASAIASGYVTSKGVTSTVGAAMGPLAVVVGAIQAGSSLNEAYDQKVSDFLSQPVSSQYAFDIVYNDDGTRKAVLDPKVAAAAGYGSGEGIRDIMNTEGTSVSLNNGGLDIKVSSGFASSEEYTKLLNDLSEYLPDGITEEMANRKDDETGGTLLEYLNKYVQDSENSYYYKAQSVKSFKEVAPAASAQSLEEACNTQLVGGMKNKELENFDIVIYDDDNQKQEVNALEYVQTVADMDPRERNDYMIEIGNRIASDEISDDEKAVLQAQANALYMVSNNKESGFKGIYKKDFLDSVADARSLFFGVRLGNLFGISPEKAAFEDNDKAQSVIILLGSIARAKTMSKMTDKIEGLLRGATTRVGQKLGVDVVKEFAQRKGFVSDVTKEAMEKAAETGAKEVAKMTGKVALNRASNLSYQLASDAIYEGARALAFAATGEGFDYWNELKNDFITDVVITYGPASFVDAMEMDGYEYRRIGDEVKLVKKTADEVASRRAKVLDKLSDSKIILKTQELFSDQNAAMGKLATQIRATVNDVTAYMRTLRYGSNIRQLTADEYSRFRTSSPEVEKHYTEYEKNLAEVAPNSKDLTDADIRYMNASANKYRFSQEFKGKRGEIRKVNAKYKEAIDGVSKERAKQLDKLMMSMRAVYADLFNYYREKGLISQEEYDRITNSPAYAGGMYFPVWKKDRKFEEGSLIIPQTRNVKKEVIDPKDLIDVDEFDNPLATFSRYSVAVMRNIAANERKLAMRDAGIVAGMRTRVVKDTGGSLKETEKLKQYNKDFKRIYDNIVKEVEKEIPTEEEHRKANMDAINRSKASKMVESIKGLQEEAHALQNKLSRQRRALKRAQNLESQKNRVAELEQRYRSADANEYSTQEIHTPETERIKNNITQNTGEDIDEMPFNILDDDNGGVIRMLTDIPGATREGSLRDYNRDYKGLETRVILVDPTQYNRVLARGRGTNTDDEIVERIDYYDSSTPKYANDMKNGDKFPVPYIKYNADGSFNGQEGRHRASAARYAGLDKIPVALSIPAGKSPSDFGFTRYDDITEDVSKLVTENANVRRSETAAAKEQLENAKKNLSDAEKRGTSEDVQKLTEDIDQTRFEIAQNKQSQVDALNELPRLTKRLMQRLSDSNKHSPLKLDIDSYINVNFANDIREALKQNNSYGAMQIAINRAADAANPYVSRESIIQERAGKSAERFRKRVSKDFPKDKDGRVDSIVDKIADKFGIKRNTYRRTGNSVTYMLNGKEERMVFEGPGAEMLVKELEAPDFVAPSNVWEAVIDKKRKIGAGFSKLKRFTTTTADVARIPPNLIRDYMRGVITTGGQILLSPDTLRSEIIENGNYTPEQIEIINRGFNLAREAISRSTFTQSLETPKKNRPKAMINAAHAETAGNAFEKYYWEFKGKSWMERASILSDMAEEFTRKRAMDVEYYRTLQRATAEGKDIDTAVKEATEAAYFTGREATTNFGRRGSYIGKLAEQTAYLSSKFATLESFKYTYLKDPIAVTRSLRTLVGSYAFMIAIALSNDESRKRYYMLTEAERASSIVVPLDNGLIVRLPLDETIAAFLTPYRRMIETLNGVDPEAFYLWGAEFLAALSPLDFTGFSEGNKFNVMRGMQKLTNDVAATWALPILENMQGYDFYYGTKIKIDSDYTDTYYGISNPTPAEMTTKNKNSQILGFVANALGMPQWKLQNYVESYGGNVGQYLLNIGDKLAGATEEAQGGKEFFDSIFKPFTGSETPAAQSALWNGIEQLNNEKEKLRNEIKDIDREIAAATGDEKAQLQEKRQNKIRDYGLRVSTFLDQYLSAYEITGGLSKSEASRIWYLYDIYGETDNTDVYADDSIEDYYNSKLNKQRNKRTTNLAALSNFGKYVNTALGNYYSVYGEQAFKNSLYGQGTQTMAKIAGALEDTTDYDNSFTKLKSDAYDARSKAYDAGDYDLADAIAYEYDLKILKAALPYLQEAGVEQSLNNSTVMDYLKDWVMVPSREMVTAKGRYLSKLPSETEKSEAYKKRFIKKMYGVLKDE